MASPLCRGWRWPSPASRHRPITWPILCLHCSWARWEWLLHSGRLTRHGSRIFWRLEWASGFSARSVSCSEHSPLPAGSIAVSLPGSRSFWADFWWEQAWTHFPHPPGTIQPSFNELHGRTDIPDKTITVFDGSYLPQHIILHGSLDTSPQSD